jgi:hypothetical protein
VRRQLSAIGYRLSAILRLRLRHSQYLGNVQRPATGILYDLLAAAEPIGYHHRVRIG